MGKKNIGFKQGTTHITTGDKIKANDYRRDKRRCFYYSYGRCQCNMCNLTKCMGSAHCSHYNDGHIKTVVIKDESYGLKKNQLKLYTFIETLINRINHNSLEGVLVKTILRQRNDVKKEDVVKAAAQKNEFNKRAKLIKAEIDKYNYETKKINNEIEQYNAALKSKCVLIGLLIITAPFCYYYYKNNLKQKKSFRDFNKEILKLETEIIDKKLKEKVNQYLLDVQLYQKKSSEAKSYYYFNENEKFYRNAKQSYEEDKFGAFCMYIMQSIEKDNCCAILLLEEIFEKSTFDEKNQEYILLLQLYSSFLGHKSSSKKIANMLLIKNPSSKLGNEFLIKAK